MPRNPQNSISTKLTLMNVLVSAVALLLACGGFCAYDMYSFRVALVRNVSMQAQIIGDNTVSALLFNDPRSAPTPTLSTPRFTRVTASLSQDTGVSAPARSGLCPLSHLAKLRAIGWEMGTWKWRARLPSRANQQEPCISAPT